VGGVGVHHRTVDRPEATQQFGSEFVVGNLKAPETPFVETPQESPEGIAVWELGQPQNGWEQSIVEEGLGIFDAAHTGRDCKDVGQKEIGRVVAPVMVRGPGHLMLEEVAESERFAKLPKKYEPTPAGQPLCIEYKMKNARPSSHPPIPYLIGRVLGRPICRRYPCNLET